MTMAQGYGTAMKRVTVILLSNRGIERGMTTLDTILVKPIWIGFPTNVAIILGKGANYGKEK